MCDDIDQRRLSDDDRQLRHSDVSTEWVQNIPPLPDILGKVR